MSAIRTSFHAARSKQIWSSVFSLENLGITFTHATIDASSRSLCFSSFWGGFPSNSGQSKILSNSASASLINSTENSSKGFPRLTGLAGSRSGAGIARGTVSEICIT